MYDKVIQNHKNDTIAEKYKYISTYLDEHFYKTLPKAKRTRGLSSYHKITVHSSQILKRLQNLNQTSASQINLKLKS